MAHVTVMTAVSIDGYFEGPNADISWHRVSDELHAELNAGIAALSALWMGRVTWQGMNAYWPRAEQDPDATPGMLAFVPVWRALNKVVVSRTLVEPGGDATLVREIDPDAIRALPGEIEVSGALLIESFARLDLIDSWRLYVNPVALGAGRRLLPDGLKRDLRLVDHRAFDTGVVRLHYARV